STEVPISNGEVMGDKLSTTVGLDYAQCQLAGGATLKLFGTPGQSRFSFMWRVLGEGAFGVIVLANNSSADPIAEVEGYLRAFSPGVATGRMVVGVGRMDSPPEPSLDTWCERLAQAGFRVPVIDVDVRRD